MDEQIEAVARAIGGTTDFDGDRMASRYTDSELRDMAIAAIAAMPDRFADGYAAAKAQAVAWLRQNAVKRSDIMKAQAIATMEPKNTD